TKSPRRSTVAWGRITSVTRGSTPVTHLGIENEELRIENLPPLLNFQFSIFNSRSWSLINLRLHSALPRRRCRLARTLPGSLRLSGRYSSASSPWRQYSIAGGVWQELSLGRYVSSSISTTSSLAAPFCAGGGVERRLS